MSDCPPYPTPQGADAVPTHWEASRTDVPRPPWTVRGLGSLPGMILLWFQPARVGASLAAAGWRTAIAAHVLGVLIGSGMIIVVGSLPALNPFPRSQRFGVTVSHDIGDPPMTWSETVRLPFAASVSLVHEGLAQTGGVVRSLLILAASEVGVVLLAVAMMPFAAAGEPAGRLFGRCLRLTWWSTTMLIPVSLGWLVDPAWRYKLGLPSEWHPADTMVLMIFGMWWLVVFVRSGYRYAGPADGPAWRARTPRCERCGYTITGLPRSTACPECGRPVAESLPENRSEPAFAAEGTRLGAVRAFGRTLHSAILNGAFFDRLAVRSGHAHARKFFLVVCGFNAAVVFVALVVLARADDGPDVLPLAKVLEVATVAAGVWLFGQVLLAGLMASIASGIARRSLQPAAVATFYALAAFVPLTVGPAFLALTLSRLAQLADRVGTSVAMTACFSLLLAVGLVACGLALVVAVRNAVRAIVRTRFANA